VKKRTQLSSRELQLLSASLDGELSKKDQKHADRLLREHPAAESSIEKLSYVKTALSLLPIRKVPRNFTISAEEVGRSFIPSLAGVLKYTSAVSAVLLAVVLAFDFVIVYRISDSGSGLARSVVETTFEEKTGSISEEETPIITWQPAAPLAGDGSGTEGEGGENGGLDMQSEVPFPDDITAPSDEQIEEMPFTAQESTTAEAEQLPQVAEQEPQVDAERSGQELASPEAESGPILNIPLGESQETIEQIVDEISEPARKAWEVVSLRVLEIGLAGLAVTTALVAGFLRRRRR